MTQDKLTANSLIMTAEAFALLGGGEVAYVKPMLSDEIRRVFPNVPPIESGLQLFALLAADGTPIMISDNRDAAIANAWEHNLQPVSLH